MLIVKGGQGRTASDVLGSAWVVAIAVLVLGLVVLGAMV
jgi:hypothetical protein